MKTQSLNLNGWHGIDLVRITDCRDRESDRVTDAGRIARLLEVLSQWESGWYVPQWGVLIMPVRLNFSERGSAVGNLGVGPGVLTAHLDGLFLQRDTGIDVSGELEQILGVSLAER